MFQASEIKRLIETTIPGSVALILDEAQDGEHFEGEVMSPTFSGISLVKQHQAVYAALGPRMGREIHALALKTYTPEAWAKAGKEPR
jgi:stress-induced morphogen